MVQEAGSAAENDKSDTLQKVTERLALLVTPIRCDSKYITVARQVVLKVLCETPVLISTQVAGVREAIPQENVNKNHACMTAKGFMDINPGRLFNITIATFDKIDVNLHKEQKVGKLTSPSQKIVHIKEERFLYPFGAKATKSDSQVNAVNYKPTPDFLKPVEEY